MKTVYITWWENDLQYEDYAEGIGSVYSSRELAEQAIKMLEAAQKRRIAIEKESGARWHIYYSWTIKEMPLMDFVAPMEDNDD